MMAAVSCDFMFPDWQYYCMLKYIRLKYNFEALLIYLLVEMLCNATLYSFYTTFQREMYL